jgi:hypothetical protein
MHCLMDLDVKQSTQKLCSMLTGWSESIAHRYVHVVLVHQYSLKQVSLQWMDHQETPAPVVSNHIWGFLT